MRFNIPVILPPLIRTLLVFTSLCASAGPSVSSAARIDSIMNLLAQRHQFNGSALVAVHNAIVYEKGFGMANVRDDIRFTPDSPSYLASVSKQFTAMAIMVLAEEGTVHYSDSLPMYFPELSPLADGVTILHLLHHTSGLPDYYSLGMNRPDQTNRDVLDTLRRIPSLRFMPGDRWEYSNSGYVLLSLIVEKASGMSFPRFMQEKIFAPLGMLHTFIYDGSQADMITRARGYDRFGGDDDYRFLTSGGGGVFSTAHDLFTWNKALYTDALVSRSTLKQAFTPARLNNDSTVNYGFGWGIGMHKGGSVVSHSGGLVGFRTYFARYLADSTAIVLLTNTASNDVPLIAHVLRNVIDGEPFLLPRRSVVDTMLVILRSQGLPEAIGLYNALRLASDTTYDCSETELHDLGYYLLQAGQTAESIGILALNTQTYPSSPDAFFSLAEAYEKGGNVERAKDECEQALRLNPNHLGALSLMKRLEENAAR